MALISAAEGVEVAGGAAVELSVFARSTSGEAVAAAAIRQIVRVRPKTFWSILTAGELISKIC